MTQVGSGEGGIRTHGGVTPTPVFETGLFNRSSTSPELILQLLTNPDYFCDYLDSWVLRTRFFRTSVTLTRPPVCSPSQIGRATEQRRP